MPRLCTKIVSGLLLGLGFCASPALAQDVTLEPHQKWTNVAAESKIELQFTVKVPREFTGRVEWAVHDVVTKRPYPGGQGQAKITADAKTPALVKILPMTMPTVKAGVVWQLQLVVSVYADGKKEPEADYKKALWIFPDDPFFDRTKWVAGLKIALYDSDPKSKTAEALKKLKVPFDEIRNPAAVADLKEGLLLVGEGVSFKDEAGLAEALVHAARRGLPVLCLAPKDGTFPLPGADNTLPAPGSLSFQRPDIITKLDKRLDAAAWAPDNQVVASSIVVKAEDGKVIGEFQAGAKGWPWLQLDYPDKKGRLVLCGFGLIRQWDASPAPRYLLARLFEHVTEPRTEKE